MDRRPCITIHIDGGEDISFELYPEKTPNSVTEVLTAFTEGYYDGLPFHTCARDEYMQLGYHDLNGYGVYAADVNDSDSDSDSSDEVRPYKAGDIAVITAKYPYLAKMQLALLFTDKPIFSGGREILFKPIGRITAGYEYAKSLSECKVDEDLSPLFPIVVKSAVVNE